MRHVSSGELVKHELKCGAHVDMWHPISGRKSTIKEKWIRGNPKSQLELDMLQVRGNLT